MFFISLEFNVNNYRAVKSKFIKLFINFIIYLTVLSLFIFHYINSFENENDTYTDMVKSLALIYLILTIVLDLYIQYIKNDKFSFNFINYKENYLLLVLLLFLPIEPFKIDLSNIESTFLNLGFKEIFSCCVILLISLCTYMLKKIVHDYYNVFKEKYSEEFLEFKNIVLIPPNKGIFILVFSVAVISILINYITSGFSESDNSYSALVFRMSIFFLGSIVTMNIYIYNSKKTISKLDFLNDKSPYIMIVGIITSLFSLITAPTKIYTFETFKLPFIEFSILGFVSFLFSFFSIFNLILFLISTYIFLISLFNFIKSFQIEKNIKYKAESIKEKYGFENISNGDLSKIPLKCSKKDWEELLNEIEVLNQSILYVLELNNLHLTKKYISEWIKISDYLVTFIFHTEIEISKLENLNDIKSFKRDTYQNFIKLYKILIYQTKDNGLLKVENKELISSFQKVLPEFHNYYLDNNCLEINEVIEIYLTNYKELKSLFYTELYHLYKNLNNTSEIRIYKMLINHDLLLKDYYKPEYREVLKNILKKKYTGKISPKVEVETLNLMTLNTLDYVEDLYLSSIFDIIEEDKNSDLPLAVALLMKVHEEARIHTIFEMPLVDLRSSPNSIPQKYSEKNKLSDRTIKSILVAMIKACELENYHAVGYLIKVFSNYITEQDFLNSLKDLQVLKSNLDSDRHTLLISKISLNRFSLTYCLEKVTILIYLQLVYKENKNVSSLLENIYSLVPEGNRESILDAIEGRKKDYNLSCLLDKSSEIKKSDTNSKAKTPRLYKPKNKKINRLKNKKHVGR